MEDKAKEYTEKQYYKVDDIDEFNGEPLAVYRAYKQCQEDMSKYQTVTRFEVIDENGRAYTDYYCNVELSYQDDGRTLKVFINSLNKQD